MIFLAVLLGVLAAGTLGHGLVLSRRLGRKDFAVLASLGLVSRQLQHVVRWQTAVLVAVAVLVGLPVGALAGRAAWRAMVDDVGIVFPARLVSTPMIVALLALLAASAAASLLVSQPLRRARPVDVLRAE